MEEEQMLLSMLVFKLVESLKYLQPLIFQKSEFIKNLWLEKDEDLPNFVEKFMMYWTADDYDDFCQQVKAWADNRSQLYEEAFEDCVKTLILRDKQAYLLGIVKKFLDESDETLLIKQSNIQQLCDEVGDYDDVIYVNDNSFEQTHEEFERLKKLSMAMCQHAQYLLTYLPAKVFKISVREQITNAKEE